MQRYKIHKLANGLTIIIFHFPNHKSVYFDLAVKVGSRYENNSNNGVSHFTEHLLFKKIEDGFKKHPWVKHYISQRLTAYTKADRTNFEFSSHKKDIKAGIKSLSEIVNLKNLSQNALIKEKQIIMEEILKDRDDPDEQFSRFFNNNYFQNNPLKFPILGTQKTVRNFSLADIKNFILEYYRPENIILTLSGDISENEAIRLIKKHFKFPKKSKKKSSNFINYSYPGDNIHLLKNKRPRAIFSFSRPIFNDNAIENLKWEFFTDILGEYLFFTLRKKLSYYSMAVDTRPYREFTDFYIETYFNPQKAVLFYSLLQKKLKEFKKSLTQKNFDYLKEDRLINLDLSKDSPRSLINIVGWHALMFGDKQIISIDKAMKIIKSINRQDIFRRFDLLFKGQKGMVFFAGNLTQKQEKELKKIWENWKI